MNTRRYPRTLEDAFGPYTSRTIVGTQPPLGWKLREFVTVYSIYRHTHSRRYSAWIAWDIAFKGSPF